jgi:Tol biopolymer transport system component
LAAILHNEPAPINKAARDPVAAELQTLIARCLRKDPQKRVQHLDDVKLALEELKAKSSATLQPRTVAAAPSRRRWAWAALLPVIAGVGLFVWSRTHPPAPSEPLEAIALTTFPGVESYPSFSPDGNHVAFSWNGPKQDNFDIYVQQIGAGSPLRLTTHPATDYDPVWSPDGNWIAFLRGEMPGRRLQSGKSELRLIHPLGGTERKLCEITIPGGLLNPAHLSWCADSNCLVTTDSTGEGKPDALFLVSLETGEKRQLTNPQPPVIADTNAAVSPDGLSLVFHRNFGIDAGELYWLPLRKNPTANGELKRLTSAMLNARYPAWMPDGRTILFSAKGNLWTLDIPGTGLPARLPFVGQDGVMPVVSRSQPGRPSRLSYARSFEDENIWRVDVPAPGKLPVSPPGVAISSTRSEGRAQISPDGRRVAFHSNRSGDNEIWLADLDGANAV